MAYQIKVLEYNFYLTIVFHYLFKCTDNDLSERQHYATLPLNLLHCNSSEILVYLVLRERERREVNVANKI